jgi:hypothetical protein
VLLSALIGAIDALRRAGADPVVLKGAPLAQALYGDATVRPVADCDLFIPLAQRPIAERALTRAGWVSRTGEPPGEESFERWAGGQRNVIEVHSSAIDDGSLSHIDLPIDARDLSLAGVSLPSFWGDHLPAFLSAHLAKHETAPLLWVVDLLTLWGKLDEAARVRARDCARRVGLERHLAWALHLTWCAAAGAEADPSALAELAQLRRPTGGWGRVRRLVGLSSTPWDAARVVAGRLWPPEWRDSWTRAPNYVLRRGAGWIARRLQLAGVRPASSTVRALAVDDTELTSLLDDTLGRGLAIWIHPRGTSMQPAIPASAAAHIVPLRANELRKDDIVLARLPHGPMVLHRIHRICDDRVQLKGDAMRRRDAVVPRSAILGRCDEVEIDGIVYRAADRPRDSVSLLKAAARSRLRRLVTVNRA